MIERERAQRGEKRKRTKRGIRGSKKKDGEGIELKGIELKGIERDSILGKRTRSGPKKAVMEK